MLNNNFANKQLNSHTTKIAIYGAGDFGIMFIDSLRMQAKKIELSGKTASSSEIAAIADAAICLQGKSVYGIPIISPARLPDIDFDILYVTVGTDRYEIYSQLRGIGIPKEKIRFAPVANKNNNRMDSVRKLSELYHLREQEGSIAECGVYQGLFALRLNWFFKAKKFYLFDTFEGFTESDLSQEKQLGNDSFIQSGFNSSTAFTDTSAGFVLDRCPVPENIVLKQGFVPDTFAGVDDQFCFVNLDMDLYAPMYEAMKFFWNKLTPNGVMLLHDFYARELEGVKKAVFDFERDLGHSVKKSPVLDVLSLAVFK